MVAPLYEKHFWPFANFRMGNSEQAQELGGNFYGPGKSSRCVDRIPLKN